MVKIRGENEKLVTEWHGDNTQYVLFGTRCDLTSAVVMSVTHTQWTISNPKLLRRLLFLLFLFYQKLPKTN